MHIAIFTSDFTKRSGVINVIVNHVTWGEFRGTQMTVTFVTLKRFARL